MRRVRHEVSLSTRKNRIGTVKVTLDMNDYDPSSSLLNASPHSPRAKNAVAHQPRSKIAAKRAELTFIPCMYTNSTSSRRREACPDAKEQAHELKQMRDCLASNGTVVDLNIQQAQLFFFFVQPPVTTSKVSRPYSPACQAHAISVYLAYASRNATESSRTRCGIFQRNSSLAKSESTP